MKFFKIRANVREFFDTDKTYHPQEVVGASDQETAIVLYKQKWEDCGYEVFEIKSCEEIFPKAVLCRRMWYDS